MAAPKNKQAEDLLEVAQKLNEPVAETLDSAQRKQNAEVDTREHARKALAEVYKAQKKIVVMGAPMYRAYFGNTMPILINGILVTVPLDGNRYEIPKSHARVFNARIHSVNEEIEMQRRRSDTNANFEAFPGQLDLVRRV